MTTKVNVEACCGDDKEVCIEVMDGPDENLSTVIETDIIQDGEVRELYVYDDRVIRVTEILKQEVKKEN